MGIKVIKNIRELILRCYLFHYFSFPTVNMLEAYYALLQHLLLAVIRFYCYLLLLKWYRSRCIGHTNYKH